MTGLLLLIVRTLLAISLYVFLAWAIITLWQDLRNQKKSIESQQPPEIWLTIRLGGTVQNRQFRGSEILLGRDPICECILPSETVSARHARFSYHHGQWWIEDLNSTNGTFLNGEPVQIAVVVAPGDRIRCGEVILKIPKENVAT